MIQISIGWFFLFFLVILLAWGFNKWLSVKRMDKQRAMTKDSHIRENALYDRLQADTFKSYKEHERPPDAVDDMFADDPDMRKQYLREKFMSKTFRAAAEANTFNPKGDSKKK